MALAAVGPAVAAKCSCDDIVNYSKMVAKKGDCYHQALNQAQEALLWRQSDTISFMEKCMGWVSGSAVSVGKNESATKQEIEEAKDRCHADYCDWICEVSIDSVHEKAHNFFDRNYRMSVYALLAYPPVMAVTAMQEENIAGEILAHSAEEQFLRQQIQQMQSSGECASPDQSKSADQRQQQQQEAQQWLQNYLQSLPPEKP